MSFNVGSSKDLQPRPQFIVPRIHHKLPLGISLVSWHNLTVAHVPCSLIAKSLKSGLQLYLSSTDFRRKVEDVVRPRQVLGRGSQRTWCDLANSEEPLYRFSYLLSCQ